MKKLSAARTGLLVVAAVAWMGCEWTGSDSGSGTAWNERVAWVNFSGVYRAASGLLVTEYTDTTVNTNTPIPVVGESVGITDGTNTVYRGRLRHYPVVAGSLVLSFGPTQVYDQGDGTLSGSGWTGTINYGTGAWVVDMGSFVFPYGYLILADYEYTQSAGGGGPGSTKYPINIFTVKQLGDQVQFIDNNHAIYTGQITEVIRSGGSHDNTTLIAGEIVTAIFEASGTSRAGMQVTMYGAFTGMVEGSGSSFTLADRRLRGTWVEYKGKTGEINGQASPSPISGP